LHYGLQRSEEPHTIQQAVNGPINQKGYFYNYQYIILLTWIFIFARNQDQGNIPSSRHQRDQKDQRGLKNLKITHKRAGNKKGYRMVLNGNIKGYQRTTCQGTIRAFFGINMSKNENPSKQNDRGRNISLVLISIPSLVETFNRVTGRVPHVEQELRILPKHPSFWAITTMKIQVSRMIYW
jgi:hypothetical protein